MWLLSDFTALFRSPDVIKKAQNVSQRKCDAVQWVLHCFEAVLLWDLAISRAKELPPAHQLHSAVSYFPPRPSLPHKSMSRQRTSFKYTLISSSWGDNFFRVSNRGMFFKLLNEIEFQRPDFSYLLFQKNKSHNQCSVNFGSYLRKCLLNLVPFYTLLLLSLVEFWWKSLQSCV